MGRLIPGPLFKLFIMGKLVGSLLLLFLSISFLNAQTNIQSYGMGDLDIDYPKFKKKYLKDKKKYIDKFLKKNPHLSFLSHEELNFIYEYKSLFYRGKYYGFGKIDYSTTDFETLNYFYLRDSLYRDEYFMKNSFIATSDLIIRAHRDDIPGFILKQKQMLTL